MGTALESPDSDSHRVQARRCNLRKVRETHQTKAGTRLLVRLLCRAVVKHRAVFQGSGTVEGFLPDRVPCVRVAASWPVHPQGPCKGVTPHVRSDFDHDPTGQATFRPDVAACPRGGLREECPDPAGREEHDREPGGYVPPWPVPNRFPPSHPARRPRSTAKKTNAGPRPDPPPDDPGPRRRDRSALFLEPPGRRRSRTRWSMPWRGTWCRPTTTPIREAPAVKKYEAGKVRLREDKRPRPLVLRAGEGDLLEVTFTNLLCRSRRRARRASPPRPGHAGFHVMGLELFDSIDSDSSWVGVNPPVKPSETQPNPVDPVNQPWGYPAASALPARRSTPITPRPRGPSWSTASPMTCRCPTCTAISRPASSGGQRPARGCRVLPEPGDPRGPYQATYYIEESHEKKLDALYESMMNRPSAIGGARPEDARLPPRAARRVHPGTLEDQNMRLAPAFDEGGDAVMCTCSAGSSRSSP